jgi:hypothetical protein
MFCRDLLHNPFTHCAALLVLLQPFQLVSPQMAAKLRFGQLAIATGRCRHGNPLEQLVPSLSARRSGRNVHMQ